ncbi:hypothetical protein KC992_01370, partial [Candidatus Saccharibacteria bacterium]|nr:hypothetical protein [Candidatus Saccharibacteria bacterium]
MKNKFTKKHKHVLIIEGTQGMAKLSLAAVSGLFMNVSRLFVLALNHVMSSTTCARALSFFDGLKTIDQHRADSTTCARALSFFDGLKTIDQHRADST